MLAAFYAALALGVFAKGPVGLLPLAVVLTWILTEDGWRGLGRLGSKLGAAVFVAVSAIWLVPFLVAGTGTFARNVVVQNWLGWYLGGPRPLGLLNYVAEFARGLIPWTVLLVLPLLWVRTEWRNGRFRFAFLAWLVPLVVTGLSQNQRTRYLLPTFPAAALLIAWWADRHGRSGHARFRSWRRWRRWADSRAWRSRRPRGSIRPRAWRWPACGGAPSCSASPASL